MTSDGLRARKRARTRATIAATAARLFAERGYENTAVVDIARTAEVSEQTVYNYFPAKHDLLLDQDEQIRDRLTTLIRNRPATASPAAAIRDDVLAQVEQVRSTPDEELRGSIAYLAAVSPAVRRLSLEMTDRHADAIAAAIVETTPGVLPAVAKTHGIALAWVNQTIIDETGRRSRDGAPPRRIADELVPVVTAVVDDLDRWLGGSRPG